MRDFRDVNTRFCCSHASATDVRILSQDKFKMLSLEMKTRKRTKTQVTCDSDSKVLTLCILGKISASGILKYFSYIFLEKRI